MKPMARTPPPFFGWLALAAVCAGTFSFAAALAQTGASSAKAATAPAPPGPHAQSAQLNRHAEEYYKAVWGVEALSVKIVESGEIARFSWRVLDPNKAKALSDKKVEPSLEDPQAGVSLVVPEMANVGQLRQTPPPEAGVAYWMAFSNKGRLVKRGHRVNVVIGPFRANGILVE
jgi:hypothetical protein